MTGGAAGPVVLLASSAALVGWFAPPAALLSDSKLNSAQFQAALTIWATLRLKLWGEPAIMAALANAVGESNLDTMIIGDEGHSVGLFQLNDRGGGAGMSVAARQSAFLNTMRIASEASLAAETTPPPVPLRQLSATPAERLAMVTWFCTYVERPKDKPGASATRRAILTSHGWGG